MTVATQPPELGGGLRHRAVFYQGIDELVRSTAPFIRDGLTAGEPVLVSVVPEKVRALREELGSDADGVRFLDMALVGRNPARILPLWQAFLDDYCDGVSVRGVGEPIWLGRRPAEIVECQLHEALLNVAFDTGPSWQLLCPYDTDALPADVIACVRRTHPALTHRSGHWVSGQYSVDAGATLLAALPEPPDGAITISFQVNSVDRVRRHVRHHAIDTGLAPDRAADLELAAHELATTSVRYGDGNAVLRYWDDPESCIVELSDCGLVIDELVGRVRAAIGDERGRTLWLVNQLCDLVQVRSSARGTTMRIRIWR